MHTTSTNQSENDCPVLYLLNVQPYPDDSEFVVFDGGLSLVPAAHLAAEEINNRSDILTGHDLEVIDIDAEACGNSGFITKGLVNVYRNLLSRKCIVGVMGFVCSESTNVLAPIIGHPAIGYITLANSASPAHRNIIKYPHLFHTISSTSVHNKVVLSMMEIFEWKKIGLIFDSLNVLQRSTAREFGQRIRNQSERLQLTTDIPITNERDIIKRAFDIINSEEARISYMLGNDGQYAHFLCEAYQRKFIWPGYVYIFRNIPSIKDKILNTTTFCSKDELLLAMEGVFLLEYRLFVDDDTELFSGWTYSQFRRRYADKLHEFASEIDMNLNEITFANSFYDQVWAFALAINNSIQSIYSENLSFLDYTLTNTKIITSIIEQELLNLSFQGASGYIKFDDNYEIPSFVDIMQIQNGTIQNIAIYSPPNNITPILGSFPETIPPDTFDTVYNLLPLWIGVCIFIVQSALFCLITTNMVLLSFWRNEREIKATSYLLSMLLTSSCYLLTIGPVIQTVYRIIVIHNTTLHTVLCSASQWSTALGLDLLLATLLFRIFRVVHVFRSFQRTSKYFSDEYILLYVSLTCSIKVLILIIWSIVDPYRSQNVREYDPTTAPPVYRSTPMCSSTQFYVWYGISYMYSAIILSFVMFLAIQTRRIKKSAFKDTKKINLFVFLVIITLCVAFPLVAIFTLIQIQIGAVVSEWIGFCSVPLFCQLCLIVPKLLPLAVKKDKLRRGKTLKREYTLSTDFEWFRRKSMSSLSKLI